MGRIEFDNAKLCDIVGIFAEGLDNHTIKNELHFQEFGHIYAVKNICSRHDPSNKVCTLFFWFQLLPFQVQILYSILRSHPNRVIVIRWLVLI